MSMMVVRDVTETDTYTSSYGVKREENLSVITPFQKFLEKASSGSADDPDDGMVRKASKKKIYTDEGGQGGSSGTTKLKNIFKRAADKYDISYDFLVAVAKAESDFNYKCVSSAGAKGIMQLMPDECKEFKVSDPFDPEQNIMAAAKLLAAHLKKFNGDFTLAAAAYNAGSGAVKKYGGVPPYKETQNYVKKIAKFMKQGVKVPDKSANVSYDYSAYETDGGSGGSSGISSHTNTTDDFDKGESATDVDWDNVRVKVGTGDDAIIMTYGAYQKYRELGTQGVG